MNDTTNKGVRRTREDLSSTSSSECETKSPQPKQRRMADDTKEPKPTLEDIFAVLMDVQSKTNALLKDTKSLKNDYEELKTSLNYQCNVVEDLIKDNKTLKAQVQHLTGALNESNEELKGEQKKIELLEDKHDELEMYSRKHNIEVHGIPESSEEDLEKVMIKVAEIVGIDIDVDDIDIVHRLPSKAKPRPIIVKFKSHKTKQSIYLARRKLRGITSHSSELNGANAVYINENLTYSRRKSERKRR